MWSVTPVLGLADTARPIVLIGFVIVMFGIAALAVVLGKRRVEDQQARALSVDAGIARGTLQGADQTHSSDWLDNARAEVDDSPKQSWAAAILGPGSLHDEEHPTPVLAPEIAVQRASAAETQQASEYAQSGWPAAPAEDASQWDTVPPVAPPGLPAYLQPEDLGPHPIAPIAPPIAPVTPEAADAPTAPPMPWAQFNTNAEPAQADSGGKRRAAVPVDAPSVAPGFLVADYLDDDDDN